MYNKNLSEQHQGLALSFMIIICVLHALDYTIVILAANSYPQKVKKLFCTTKNYKKSMKR